MPGGTVYCGAQPVAAEEVRFYCLLCYCAHVLECYQQLVWLHICFADACILSDAQQGGQACCTGCRSVCVAAVMCGSTATAPADMTKSKDIHADVNPSLHLAGPSRCQDSLKIERLVDVVPCSKQQCIDVHY